MQRRLRGRPRLEARQMGIALELTALRLDDGSAVKSVVAVSDPVRLDWADHGYQARLTISGFTELDTNAYGGSAIQALEYAIQFARVELMLHSGVWRYEGPDGNSIDLIYPQIAMPI